MPSNRHIPESVSAFTNRTRGQRNMTDSWVREVSETGRLQDEQVSEKDRHVKDKRDMLRQMGTRE